MHFSYNYRTKRSKINTAVSKLLLEVQHKFENQVLVKSYQNDSNDHEYSCNVPESICNTHEIIRTTNFTNHLNNFIREFATLNKSMNIKTQFHASAIKTVNSCCSAKNECCACVTDTTDEDYGDSDLTFFSESNDSNLTSLNENLAN